MKAGKLIVFMFLAILLLSTFACGGREEHTVRSLIEHTVERDKQDELLDLMRRL